MSKTNSLGLLCNKLSTANIMVYHYENRKWWDRKKVTSTSKMIDEWDKLSRTWCERRNKVKNEIDSLFASKINQKETYNKRNDTRRKKIPFQVLPLSLIIDMLTIENIKIYDLRKKKQLNLAKKAQIKKNGLIKLIDKTIEDVIKTGKYEFEPEVRTF